MTWHNIPDAIYFYRTSGDNGYLSNLHVCPVIFEGNRFPTAEHAYQFGKFKDKKTAEWAMRAPKPHLLCIVAHGLLPYDVVEGWTEQKVSRMRKILRAKFTQNTLLMDKLLSTGDAQLVENSKTDSFWGCGKNGKGQNTLGMLLMELRDNGRKVDGKNV